LVIASGMRAAPEKNHFELFGLPVKYDVDLVDLLSRYREMQRRIHPDKFALSSDQDRRISLQMTALVNDAFQILKDPIRRGRYLLSLRGIDIDDESDTSMDSAFLLEQLEWRENLEEVRQVDNPHKKMAELANLIEKRLQKGIENFRGAVIENTPEATLRARNTVRELQFLDKMRKEIGNLEEEMG
jgi:molecular chaperone HscB